jgi:hypothetical protein
LLYGGVMTRRIFLLLTFTAVACTAGHEGTADSSGSSAAADAERVRGSEWVVTTHGAGPLRIGMSIDEARAAARGALAAPSNSDPSACTYVPIAGAPKGIAVMVEGGRVVRIDVDSGSVPTAEGARVGDTEERIRTIYPGDVTIAPHKYTNGHYLTVRPKSAADSVNRIVFETDGRAVTRYRVGVPPPVEYVEGCG